MSDTTKHSGDHCPHYKRLDGRPTADVVVDIISGVCREPQCGASGCYPVRAGVFGRDWTSCEHGARALVAVVLRGLA